MARKERVKKNKYSYEKEIKKVVKDPNKRRNAGIVVFINGHNMEYPPRVVSLAKDVVSVKDIEISKKFFENSKITIDGFPAVLIKDNDIMTSAGLYYNSLVSVSGEYSPPKQIYMDGYYVKEEKGKEKKVEGKRPILNTFQPSETLPPSILQAMVYSQSKVSDIKEWLKKNKMVIYMVIGVLGACAITLLLSYQMYSDQLPKILSEIGSIKGTCVAKAAEVVSLN